MSVWRHQVDKGISLTRNTHLNHLMFADDTVIIQESEDKLQVAVHKLYLISKHFNMKISAGKTKIMAFHGKWPIRSKIVVENKILEQVSNFKYLGCDITYDYDQDLQQKVSRFNMICGAINRSLRNRARKNTLLKFYKVMAIPALAYGSEAWVLTKKHESKIQAAEMRFLRQVKGCTREDRIRNEEIRKECDVQPILSILRTYRKNWSDHVIRMSQERLPRSALLYKPTGKRNVGRPRKRWTPEQA